MSFNPIPATMPLSAAADLMVRRGEAGNFHQALGRLRRQRGYGRLSPVRTKSSDPALAAVEQPRQVRLPYRDD